MAEDVTGIDGEEDEGRGREGGEEGDDRGDGLSTPS